MSARCEQCDTNKPDLAGLAALGLACAAGVVLVLCVAVHGLAWTGFDSQLIFPKVWFLHLAAMALCVCAMLLGRKHCSRDRIAMDHIFPFAPKWMMALVFALFAYALVNFAIFGFQSADGSPTMRDNGAFALTDHGDFVREIDEVESCERKALELRGASGHWMIFACLAETILYSRYRASHADEAAVQG